MPTWADLMTPAPARWGLRGDPVLWELMTDQLADMPLPKDQTELRRVFAKCFRDITEHDLDTAADHLHVPATLRSNSGMSRGMVSGLFWRDTALPLVLSRFKATQG